MSKNLNTCIEPYLASFIESIASKNYSPATLKAYRTALRKVGHEMDLADINPSQLTPDLAERVGRKVPRKKPYTVWPYRLARRFTQHLIDIGVAQPVPLTEAQQARAKLFENFETYLVKQRGLSPRSVTHTMGFARRLLDYRFAEAMIETGSLRPNDVIEFMEHVMSGARRDKTVATHVRIFLQYLFASGATTTNLSLCLPRTAQRWAPRLPRHLAPEGVEAVLAWVRGNPRTGARDFAMLLLMARLGLRAAELIAIELDDINWRASELTVRGKGKLHDRLAEQISARICYELGLPADLHESHASYIGHWLDILKSDRSAIITAAAKADQAFTYLAAFSGYDSEAQEEDHDTVELQACA